MNTPKTTESYAVSIFIAGDPAVARQTCREFCMRGLCVTVTETEYVFTGGAERGIIVGLINYPRFPETPAEIKDRAIALAELLLSRLCQRSCSVQTPNETLYIEREIEVRR